MLTKKQVTMDIANAIKVHLDHIKWQVISVPFNIKTCKYKDEVGILTAVNNEYIIKIQAKPIFDDKTRKQFPWKICKFRVSVDIDDINIMDVVTTNGIQYSLIADYISDFVFNKLWVKYCSTYSNTQDWF